MANTTAIDMLLVDPIGMAADKADEIAAAARYQHERTVRDIAALAELTWTALRHVDDGLDTEVVLDALDLMRALAANANAMRELADTARFVVEQREKPKRSAANGGSANA